MEKAEKLGRPVLRKLLDGTWIMDIWYAREQRSYTGMGDTYVEATLNAVEKGE